MLIKKKISIVTFLPSPYQVELFDAVAEEGIFSVSVIYLYSRLKTSSWKNSSVAEFWQIPRIKHQHLFLDDDRKKYTKTENLINESDLAVFNYYRHPFVSGLIKNRANRKMAWCLWGERLGCRNKNYFGNLYRSWKLLSLHRSKAPIWGIGEWAVREYRKEFGKKRKYFNVPYYSDLDRFTALTRPRDENADTVFLFSGSLIRRKGIGLLANAFVRLARELPNAKLNILGDGRMKMWLEQKLAKYKDRIRFLGFQSWEKVPEIYEKADFLCVPSRYDGWALVIPEGLAAGLPVISTERAGAALEFIRSGENGWIVQAGNEKSLYKAMKKAALLSCEEKTKLSLAARSSITGHLLKNGVKKFQKAAFVTLSVWS